MNVIALLSYKNYQIQLVKNTLPKSSIFFMTKPDIVVNYQEALRLSREAVSMLEKKVFPFKPTIYNKSIPVILKIVLRLVH